MNPELSKAVLTLSVSYDPPKGGIAQVIKTYSSNYPVFNHIATTGGDSASRKFLTTLSAFIIFLYYCFFKEIRIVHIHGASNNSFWRKRLFFYLAKIFRKKIIYHVHGAEYKIFYEKNSRVVKHMIKNADVVVALSASWRDFFTHQVGHSNVKIIENIVPPPTVKEVKDDRLVHFLFLGELGARKGIYDLLHAIADQHKSLEGKAIFHIAGNGEVAQVKQLICDLELENLIKFEGWVTGDQKIHLLNLADAYILPSYNEGLPISILEAMTYKLPIISTPVGGIPEIVTHEENGLLVSPGDTTALGEAIIRIFTNPNFRRSAGAISYAKVQSHFPDTVFVKLEAMYRELVE